MSTNPSEDSVPNQAATRDAALATSPQNAPRGDDDGDDRRQNPDGTGGGTIKIP